MRLTMDDIRRLCDETNMEYEEAVALLRRFEGDYRKALRAWQDERSIFIEPLSIEEGVRPAGDVIRQGWRKGLALIRRVHPLRMLSLIALIASFVFSKQIGGWMLLILLIIRCLPVLGEMLSSFLSHAERPAARIIL